MGGLRDILGPLKFWGSRDILGLPNSLWGGFWGTPNLSGPPRHAGGAALLWVLGYLLFFRTPWVWGLPEPPPYANALQLLVTLKMASLASDVQELREAELKGVTSEETRLLIGSLRRVPSLIDILCYSYCYLGLLTGPFYRLGTYLDWVWGPPGPPALRRLLSHVRWALLGVLGVLVGRAWPARAVLEPEFGARPWAARLAHMVPVFLALRLRLYVGWLCAEGGCVAAGLGAYPKSARAKPGQGPTVPWERPKTCADIPDDQWDFESIRTVDPWGTEVGRRFRGGLRRWNMTVQWWLAAYVHRRGPRNYPMLRNAWTMLASAYWHGLHGGQYLSFLTVPLWLNLGGWKGSALRGAQWFLKMRAFEYLSMGFVLREAAATLRFWASVHFCLHLVPLLILLTAAAAGKGREKGRGKGREEGRGKGREEREVEAGTGDAQVRRRRERCEGEGGDPLNPKGHEGGNPLNPKIQGGDLLNPKIHEGEDTFNPKIDEAWDPLNPKVHEGGDPLNLKNQGENPLNPKIDEGWNPLNPKIQGENPLNPKIHEGEDTLSPKIQEGEDPLNPKIQKRGDALNPKIQEGGDPLNPKIQEGGDPLKSKIHEGWDPLNPKREAREEPPAPKSQELRKRRDPEGRDGDEPQ
uniref:Leukocyte receptor cluster member 4 n=1 Tax=Geospiza parvula TaxID=87175 RepID=A0A8C3NAA5_GEOPR